MERKNSRINRAQYQVFIIDKYSGRKIWPLYSTCNALLFGGPGNFAWHFLRQGNNMIRNLIAIMAVILISTFAGAQNGGTISSKSNIFGGQNYSDGVTSRANIFGGQNYTKPGGGFSSATPNTFGGFNSSTGGNTRPNILGGQNYTKPFGSK